MSTPDRLTDEEPRVTLTDGEVRDVHVIVCAHDEPGRTKCPGGSLCCCEAAVDMAVAKVERILAARLAAQPPAIDRDALAGGEEHFPWHYTEFGVICACGEAMNADEECLAARPAPDTLADRVQANPVLLDALRYYEERWTMSNPKGWNHVHRAVSRSRAAYPSTMDEQYAEALAVLARLAGRSDASPEGVA